jgi:hypothetical protein
MWDRSYRWQRLARVSCGIFTVLAAVAALIVVSQTEAAGRAAAGVAEITRESNPDAESTVRCVVPVDLNVRRGGLVYREGPDGTAEIVGRVLDVRQYDNLNDEITVLLTPAAAGAMVHGGKLQGAKPTLSVEHAFRLIISPEIPRDELARARDALWPAMEEHVLPGLKDRITHEVTRSFEDLDEEDAALLDATIKDLRDELTELEEKLLNRLANRAWEVIGVSGVAEGVIRKTGDGASNTYRRARDWVRGWWTEPDETDTRSRDFLSEERATALRIALEEEVETFLREHDDELREKFNTVLNNRRADFVEKFETKWGPKLYENALVPSWFEGEDDVLVAAEQYANDFARRRLLTSEGGPRLLLAYALRSSLGITSDPLLVIVPAQADEPADGVEFEWLMPRLAKDGG